MGQIKYAKGTGIPHSSFDAEFLTHDECSEWWYCTGYLESDSGRLFGYQFTLAWVKIMGIRFHILICAVTDFENQKHYDIQTPIFFGKDIVADDTTIAFGDKVQAAFEPNEFSHKGHVKLHMESAEFTLDADMNAVKPPVWQCEDGVLQMGIQNDPKERTYYYSYTNLATTASLVLNGEHFDDLKGKTWFDRQGGTYSLTKPECNWEWFSLRFFDNTEAMLFAFPQDDYYDGTYIERDGSYRRMNDYKLEAIEVIIYNKMKFSSRWKLTMNGRNYVIEPKVDGMFNLYFFELLADIVDDQNQVVGYCFVELLPGVRNKNSVLDAFKIKR